MNTLQRFVGHCKTVNKHRRLVRKLCFQFGLYRQGITHDLSKYSPIEFLNGVRFYTGKKSPHCGERDAYGYSKAWLHHKGRNKHHAEYWQDIMPCGTTQPVPIPENYLLEMICDRVAASMTYCKDAYTNASPWEYYCAHKHENNVHPETRRKLESALMAIASQGMNPIAIRQIIADDSQDIPCDHTDS